MRSSCIKDIIARLTELSKKRNYTDEEKQELASLYPQVTQFVFVQRKGCADCYRDACIEMVTYLRKHGKFRERLNFVLRNGVVIQLGGFGSSDFYTNANLCDAVAIAYLREHPDEISLFQRYPDNWKELINDESTRTKAQE